MNFFFFSLILLTSFTTSFFFYFFIITAELRELNEIDLFLLYTNGSVESVVDDEDGEDVDVPTLVG